MLKKGTGIPAMILVEVTEFVVYINGLFHILGNLQQNNHSSF